MYVCRYVCMYVSATQLVGEEHAVGRVARAA